MKSTALYHDRDRNKEPKETNMKTITSIKNNKINAHPQYDVVQRGETVGRIVRICAKIPRRNHSNGSNRWDIMVYVPDRECQECVTVEVADNGTVVGRRDGEDVKVAAYMGHTNVLGGKDREYLDVVPADCLTVDLDQEQLTEVKRHVQFTWGFVTDDDGTRRQIASFPWPTENHPKW